MSAHTLLYWPGAPLNAGVPRTVEESIARSRIGFIALNGSSASFGQLASTPAGMEHLGSGPWYSLTVSRVVNGYSQTYRGFAVAHASDWTG